LRPQAVSECQSPPGIPIHGIDRSSPCSMSFETSCARVEGCSGTGFVSHGDIGFQFQSEYSAGDPPISSLQHMYTGKIRSPRCRPQLFISKAEGSWSLMLFYPKVRQRHFESRRRSFWKLEWTQNPIPAKSSDALSEKSQVDKINQPCRQLLYSVPIRAKGSSRKQPSRWESKHLTRICAHSFC